MKKKLLLIFFLFITSYSFSEEIFHLTLSPFFGIRYGEISKSLYLNSTDTKVSELVWEEKPVYEFGIKTEITLFNFETDIRFCAGLPVNSGSMFDSDWTLNGIKKTYTISQCDVIKNFDTIIGISYHTPRFSILRFDPEIQVQYLYKDFKAHDGYGWYGAAEHAKIPRDYDVPWNDPLARKAKKIRDIDYYRHTLLTWIGFKTNIYPVQNLTFQTGLFISPLIYNYSLDTHYRSTENTHYLDIQYGYFSKFKITVAAEYQFTKILALFSEFNSIFGQTDYGDLYADEYSDDLTLFPNQPTSSNIWHIEFNLGAKIIVK